MDGYSISQVAERTGFPPTTLRYYEQAGLVRPERTTSGYRSYDDRDVELLAFVGRAKGFGLSLDEITELLGLLDEEQCAPFPGRLRELVDTKIAEARDTVAELQAFTAELERVAATLGRHTPDGPCDDTCGCTTEQTGGARNVIELTAKPSREGATAIACTLAPDRIGDRLAAWQSFLSSAFARTPIRGGSRVRFGRDVDVSALATLIVAEQDCCQFFTFALTISTDEVALDITGPADARTAIAELFGPAK